jgi:hypothetical protein
MVIWSYGLLFTYLFILHTHTHTHTQTIFLIFLFLFLFLLSLSRARVLSFVSASLEQLTVIPKDVLVRMENTMYATYTCDIYDVYVV